MISLFIHLLILAVIFIAFNRTISGKNDRIVFSSFIILKISCGILMGFLYRSYYSGAGDTIYFYEQSQVLFNYFQTGKISFFEWIGIDRLTLSNKEFSSLSEPRTFFFVRSMSFLYAFTQGNYFTMSVYLSFFSGLTTWAFAHELGRISKENKLVIFISLLFIPSVTFWSSGLLKESLMTIALYASGFSVLKLIKKPAKWLFAIPAILSVWVLWKVKYYVPITLTPLVILTVLFQRRSFLSKVSFPKKLVLYIALLIIGGVALAFIHPVFHSGRFFELIRISHDVIARNSDQALIHFQTVGNDITFFIQNLPLAWFTGIFRPFLWEAFSIFSLLWALEKTVFIILSIFALVLSFKLKFTSAERWWGIAILIYASVLSSIIALATPNFGTLVRYQVAYMPAMWLLVLMILNKYRKRRRQ